MTWSLKRKVLAGYGLFLVLTAITAGWSVVNLKRLGSASNAILRENYRSILAMDHLNTALELQDRASLLVLLGRVREARAQFSAQTASFYEWYGREEDNITIPGEGELAARLGKAYGRYRSGFAGLAAAERAGGTAARSYYDERLRGLRDTVAADIASLKELNQTTMYHASARAERIASGAIVSVAAVALVLIALGLLAGIVLSRMVVRPINRLIAATANIADGSYELEIEARSNDELGTLTRSFNGMVRRINEASQQKVEEVLTEKRTSEAIVQSIEDGIIVVDRELTVILMNPAAMRFLDYLPDGRSHHHLLEVLNDQTIYEMVRDSMKHFAAPIVSEENEGLVVDRDGSSHYYQVAVNPISASEVGISGVVLLLRDVTRLKEVERLKSEFVMTASHELKTPLTGISMSVSLLSEHLGRALDAKDQELLDAAREETARLTSLVNDLLDLSRIEAGRIELDFQSVMPSLILEKACAPLRQQAVDKGLTLEWEAGRPESAARADVAKSTWVVTNLIANALRHTPSGGRIRCSADRHGEWIHFAVADSGCGIAPEDQSRIFEKFSQVTGERGGTGLGLAICREVVRASGGTIWVDSEPGVGSTFTFALPVAPAAERSDTDE